MCEPSSQLFVTRYRADALIWVTSGKPKRVASQPHIRKTGRFPKKADDRKRSEPAEMLEQYQHRRDIEEKRAEKKSKKNPKRYLQFAQNFPIVIRMAQHTEQRRNAMYENLKDRIWAIASLMEEINQAIENNELNLETLEELYRELEIGDYSLISAVHGAWVEAKEAQEAGTK